MAFVVFLLVAFVGALVQTVTGFALGMILIALAAGLQLVSIPVLTATASFLSLANVVLALRTQHEHINWEFWRLISMGQVPAIGVGLYLMMQLNDSALVVLQLFLGLFVLAGSMSMMRANPTLKQPSAALGQVLAGLGGGIVGGMFSASGPVMGWFFYRQPLPIEQIRATLLACFAVTTTLRSLLVGVRGELTMEIAWLTLASLPAIALGTWLGGRLTHRLPPQALRRWAFGLLTLMGVGITARAIYSMLDY
jgi:uncharacterized membrane protein YfcA